MLFSTTLLAENIFALSVKIISQIQTMHVSKHKRLREQGNFKQAL